MTQPEQIRKFLTDPNTLLPSRRKIADKAGIPYQGFQKFLNSEHYRGLTADKVERLLPVLGELGFKLKND